MPFSFRHEVNKDGKNRWHKDGLNSLNYKLVETVKEKLYTKFVVELLDEDPYEKYQGVKEFHMLARIGSL